MKIDVSYIGSNNGSQINAVDVGFPCEMRLPTQTGQPLVRMHRVTVRRGSVHINNYHADYGTPPLNMAEFCHNAFRPDECRIPLCYRMRIMIIDGTLDMSCLSAIETEAFLNMEKSTHTLQEAFDIMKKFYHEAPFRKDDIWGKK